MQFTERISKLKQHTDSKLQYNVVHYSDKDKQRIVSCTCL